MSPVLLTDSVTTDPPRAVNYALLWGMDGVVLRTVGGAGDRVPFINEGATRRRLEESELTLAAVDPGMFEGAAANPMSWLNEIDTLDDIAAFCGRMGCDTVRAGALALESDAYDADASASALRKLGARAEALGLRLAVRNEAACRYYFSSPPELPFFASNAGCWHELDGRTRFVAERNNR